MMYREINRYMKLASYRKNYPKYQTGKKKGKYINSEFVELTHQKGLYEMYPDAVIGRPVEAELITDAKEI